MGKKDDITPCKITIKVWKPVVTKLEARMNEACLRRDLFLARLLATEVQHLDTEVAIANSQLAYDHVFERLDSLERKSMSLALPPDLVEQINAVCLQKCIVRDAFFNRLFLLLAASPKLLDSLLFPSYDGNWKQDVWRKYGNDSATVDLGVLPLASVTDPFWAIREIFETESEASPLQDWTDPITGKSLKMVSMGSDGYTLPDGVYTKYLDAKAGDSDLIGMNCFVPDWLIPQHPSSKKHRDELDAIFGAI